MLLSMSQENGLRRMNRECGWSLGLFFDYHGGDDPQPMLSLVSPNELNKSGRDILSPCVRLSRIALSFIV